MVVDVPMDMVQLIVHADKTFVVDDANFDIILITMSIYTKIHTMSMANRLTFSLRNQKTLFYFFD
jgi:hypothetical protein